MKELKPIGFIVEQKNVYGGRKADIIEWVRFSTKIYRTLKDAEDAYYQSPYRNPLGGSYNVAGRTVPVYRKENELPILIKKEKI